jgi:hypothetical protein
MLTDGFGLFDLEAIRIADRHVALLAKEVWQNRKDVVVTFKQGFQVPAELLH